MHVNSTESSMTLSWKQSGNVDEYVIQQNNTRASYVSTTGVGSAHVSATVSNLTKSGAVYCINVTAVIRVSSVYVHSDDVELCNYTGTQCLYMAFAPVIHMITKKKKKKQKQICT